MLRTIKCLALGTIFLAGCVTSAPEPNKSGPLPQKKEPSVHPVQFQKVTTGRVQVTVSVSNDTVRDQCFWTVNGRSIAAYAIFSENGEELVSLDEGIADVRSAKKNRIARGASVVVTDFFDEPFGMAYEDAKGRIVRKYKQSDTLFYTLSVAVSDCSVDQFNWKDGDFVQSEQTLRISF